MHSKIDHSPIRGLPPTRPFGAGLELEIR